MQYEVICAATVASWTEACALVPDGVLVSGHTVNGCVEQAILSQSGAFYGRLVWNATTQYARVARVIDGPQDLENPATPPSTPEPAAPTHGHWSSWSSHASPTLWYEIQTQTHGCAELYTQYSTLEHTYSERETFTVRYHDAAYTVLDFTRDGLPTKRLIYTHSRQCGVFYSLAQSRQTSSSRLCPESPLCREGGSTAQVEGQLGLAYAQYALQQTPWTAPVTESMKEESDAE